MLPLIENTANDFVLRVKKLVSETNNNNVYFNELNKKDFIHVENVKNGKTNIDRVNLNKSTKKQNILGDNKEDLHFQSNYKQELYKEQMKELEQEEKHLHNNRNGDCFRERINDVSEERYINTENKEIEFSKVVDSDELVGGYTADAIVPCAFGVKSHVMDNPNDPFAVALGAFYELTFANIFEK